MTAAAPLPFIDPLSWLPPHMHAAARRCGFSLRDCVAWGTVPLFGRTWHCDDRCAIDSGEETDAEPSRVEAWLENALLFDPRTEATPEPLPGGYVRIGPAVIAASYHGLVEELHPSAVWEAAGSCRVVVASVAGRPVAIVAPVRMP